VGSETKHSSLQEATWRKRRRVRIILPREKRSVRNTIRNPRNMSADLKQRKSEHTPKIRRYPAKEYLRISDLFPVTAI
jgi:hypothetical protein